MPKRAADDDEASASTKKKAKQDTDEPHSPPDGQLHQDGQGNYYLDLGSFKRVTVSVFKERVQLDIREFYTDKSSGDIKPGKKGITLNVSQWTSLCQAVPALTEKLESVQRETKAVESGEPKKPAPEKPTKTKKSEKPAKKKKKKQETQHEGDDED